MRKIKVVTVLFLLVALSGFSQEIGYLRIGFFGEAWPFKNHLIKEPYSSGYGGFELGAGISIFDMHVLEAGFTTGFSMFGNQTYGDPTTFDTPEVTETIKSIFYFKGQILFFPSNLIHYTQYPKRIDPYLIVDYGPEVSYYKKTITLDYPTYQIDTLHILRSPSMNLGIGLGVRISLSSKTVTQVNTINFQIMYMFSGPTNYGIINTNLGYFEKHTGRKEYLFFAIGLTMYNLFQQ